MCSSIYFVFCVEEKGCLYHLVCGTARSMNNELGNNNWVEPNRNVFYKIGVLFGACTDLVLYGE